MGALTNKMIQYRFRTWEHIVRTTLDTSNITNENLRVETSKLKKIRYLPISYWITNMKRFNIQNKDFLGTKRLNSSIKNYFKIVENTNLLILFELLKKIYITLTTKQQNNKYFCATKISINRNVYNDLLLIKDDKYTIDLSNKIEVKRDIKQNTILLANSRIEFPTLTGNIHFDNELYNHTCFSAFNSTFNRTELPFSQYNLIFSFLYGFINITNTMLLFSYFTTIVLTFSCDWIHLKPLYIDNTLSYPKYSTNNLFYLLSSKKFNIFHNPLLSTNISITSTLIIDYEQANVFDSFLSHSITQKLSYRLLLLMILTNIKYNRFIYHYFSLSNKRCKPSLVKRLYSTGSVKIQYDPILLNRVSKDNDRIRSILENYINNGILPKEDIDNKYIVKYQNLLVNKSKPKPIVFTLNKQINHPLDKLSKILQINSRDITVPPYNWCDRTSIYTIPLIQLAFYKTDIDCINTKLINQLSSYLSEIIDNYSFFNVKDYIISPNINHIRYDFTEKHIVTLKHTIKKYLDYQEVELKKKIKSPPALLPPALSPSLIFESQWGPIMWFNFLGQYNMQMTTHVTSLTILFLLLCQTNIYLIHELKPWLYHMINNHFSFILIKIPNCYNVSIRTTQFNIYIPSTDPDYTRVINLIKVEITGIFTDLLSQFHIYVTKNKGSVISPAADIAANPTPNLNVEKDEANISIKNNN